MAEIRDTRFYSELKQLNHDLITFLRDTQDKSPYFDLSPTLGDYIKQFNELDKKYPENKQQQQQHFSNSAAAASSTLELATNKSEGLAQTANNVNNVKTTPKLQGLSSKTGPIFGTTNIFSTPVNSMNNAPLPQPVNSQPSQFLFGAPAAPSLGPLSSSATSTLQAASTASTLPSLSSTTTATSLFSAPSAGTAPTSFFSFGGGTNIFSSQNKKSDDPNSGTTATTFGSFGTTSTPFGSANVVASTTTDATNNDDGDDEAPPEPKIDKYEEPDSKYSVKCKLYEKGKGPGGEPTLNLLGVGQLFIKPMEEPNKLQVIFRQDPDLRRVLMNEVLTPNLPVKPLPKAVQMVFLSPSGESKFFIAKLKDEDDANNLIEHLKF